MTRPQGQAMSKRQEERDKQPDILIRTFICIEIPESIRTRVGRLQETLRKIDAQVSWTEPSSIHLTLKFLGGVHPSRLQRVGKSLERAAIGIGPIEVEIGGVGCFPSIRNPRVLWIGISSVSEPLNRLHSKIEDELTREDFEREKRKFSPHLTIGRIRTPQNAACVAETLITTGFDSATFTATEVILMRSDLTPSGSIYTPQAAIRLT
jgi:RNA 2',3'-cyclic 3'-phosphodiesterase